MSRVEWYRDQVFGQAPDSRTAEQQPEGQQPDIAISSTTGDLLEALCMIHRPRLVVEVGTLTGYSTARLARSVSRYGGRVVGIERDPEYAALTSERLKLLGPEGASASVLCGDAVPLLADLDLEHRALIFLDGAKHEYTSYFEALADRLEPGDLIVADDAYAPISGRFDDEPGGHQAAVAGIHKYNVGLAADARFFSRLVPVGSGLMISVRIGEAG
ncbi:hypothetical protein GCM10009554_62000 [Kribbella koreensis]|uniref:O-methyltransferase YrrM n=1 Tax=Kribbella koreensis TaxID=57909 RepID=A0ABP4BV11_9ACTN